MIDPSTLLSREEMEEIHRNTSDGVEIVIKVCQAIINKIKETTPWGYYWTDIDYDTGGDCSGVYFGNPSHVIDGDDMIPIFKSPLIDSVSICNDAARYRWLRKKMASDAGISEQTIDYQCDMGMKDG